MIDGVCQGLLAHAKEMEVRLHAHHSFPQDPVSAQHTIGCAIQASACQVRTFIMHAQGLTSHCHMVKRAYSLRRQCNGNLHSPCSTSVMSLVSLHDPYSMSVCECRAFDDVKAGKALTESYGMALFGLSEMIRSD